MQTASQSYLQEFENQILEKIHSKGWNVYKSTDSIRLGSDEVIRKYFAKELELNERYVMMPQADDPRNTEQVMNALEELAIRLNGQMPTIIIDGERFPWTGFIPREVDIKVNTIEGHYISYPQFIEALDSIVQVS